MATLTVTNLNDSGAGSLRQALADAAAMAGADDIVFDPSLFGGTIRLASSLQITTDEVFIEGDINGDGIADITISGDTNNDGNGDVSLLNNSATATINGIIFDKGLDVGSSAYIIDNDFGGTLTLTNSYVTDAVLNGTAGFVGTIRNAGDLTISNVLIENTTANLSGASAGAGGIANFGGGTLSVDLLGVTGSATSADSSYVVLGINNYGSTTGGILAIGDGQTGEDGTGLVNRSSGTGLLTIGVSGTRGADTLNVSGAPTGQLVFGFGGDDTIVGSGNNDTLFGGLGNDTLSGGAGNDTLLGGKRSDILIGGAGNDLIEGATGGDIIVGGIGVDTIHGQGGGDDILAGAGDDVVFAGNAADTVSGGQGNDTLNGNDGTDTINGGSGNDIINAGRAPDTVNGQEGDDTIRGNAQSDLLNGGRGNDTIFGGIGNDVLNGQADDDILDGQQGNDILSGGQGNDIFVFTASGGDDIITDFRGGPGIVDRIDFTAAGFANFADAMSNAAQVGGHVVFSISAGTLTVLDQTIAGFVADDLIL